MKKIIKNIFPIKLIEFLQLKFPFTYAINSYAQEGEDMVLNRIFGDKTGFYVDVGAHHPMRFSNTYALYKKGWKGINIEPNPDNFKLFKKFRKKDINLNIGISAGPSKLNYYMFNESALNTFDKNVKNERENSKGYFLKNTIEVNTYPLGNVLKQFSEQFDVIDLMTVDVEGYDLEVLKSNDWRTFKPSWILVEQLNLKDLSIKDFEINNFLESHGYVLFAKTFNTLFYKIKC